jgi:hypothetical protein
VRYWEAKERLREAINLCEQVNRQNGTNNEPDQELRYKKELGLIGLTVMILVAIIGSAYLFGYYYMYKVKFTFEVSLKQV